MAKNTTSRNSPLFFALTRISLGLVFLWAFFDKLFGLGYATCRNQVTDAVTYGCDAAWISGGSPTNGFLTRATSGPLADFYQSLAGNQWVDWMFMIGLLAIGTALVLGIAMKLAAFSGALMLLMMWSAALWPQNNPLIDDHIVYALALIGLYYYDSNQALGLRNWWQKQKLVKQYKILQ
jgi:thiosulfate dehydrogenase [quinone] large subunit